MTGTDGYKPGQHVRAFHPGMFGVVAHGVIVKVGHKWLTVDFGLRGVARVAPRDVVGLFDRGGSFR